MVISLHPQHGLFRGMRILVAIVLSVFSMAVAKAAEVEAALDRESVPAGNGALLTLTISGGQAGTPAIPAVEKLILQPRGQSSPTGDRIAGKGPSNPPHMRRIHQLLTSGHRTQRHP